MSNTVPMNTPRVPMHKRLAAGEKLDGQSLNPKSAPKVPTTPKTPA